jgi:hypothetical protein
MEAVAQAEYHGAIYYYNALSERDKKTLDDKGNLVVEKEGSEFYAYLVEKLHDYLGLYEGLNDPSIKRVYFPTTVFVSNGKIASVHLDTLPSQSDGYAPLNDAQHVELLNGLLAEIAAIQPMQP